MSKSVIVVGGGVIGMATAYYAQQKGHRVTVLERGAPDHDCCSRNNAGMVVPSHFVPLAAPGAVALGLKWMWNPESPFYIKPRLDAELLNWGWKFWRAATAEHVARSAPLIRDLSLASRQLFEELAAVPGNDFELVRKGLLMLCRTEHGLAEETRTGAAARQLGIPAEVLTPEATAKLEPGIRMEIAGAVHYPLDCHLTPHRFIDALARGQNVSWNTEVTGWRVEGGHIAGVQTNRGELAGDEYVIAGGIWSTQLVRSLGVKLPMQAGKGYSVTVPRAKRLPAICSILTEARIAVTPMGDSLRLGGTMEIAGLDERVNPSRVSGILKAIPHYFPEYTTRELSGLPVWHGFRPFAPDGMPYMGRVSRYANLCVATGHSMMGLSLGPITGKLMAQVLSDEKPAIDLTLLSPDRYQ